MDANRLERELEIARDQANFWHGRTVEEMAKVYNLASALRAAGVPAEMVERIADGR